MSSFGAMLRRPWYGWWVLFATTAAITLQSGVYIFGFGAFFVPIVAEFGWSRAVASGAVSLARLENGLIGPLEGHLIDRWGARRVMLLGIPLFGLGFIALSWVDSLVGYYLVYIFLLSLGASFGFFSPSSAAVANWFVRRRATALGLMSCGIAFGTWLVPALAWVISEVGWRNAAVLVGVLVWVIGIPLALMVRHRPEDYGLLPDNGALPRGSTRTIEPSPDDRPIPARAALRMPAFWILAVGFGLRVMVTGAVSLHLIPLMTDIGLAPEMAGIATAALGALSIVGRLGFGWLGDTFGQKQTYAAGLVALMAAFVILANTSTLLGIGLFLLLYAPAYGGLAAQMLALRADYFGRRSFGTIGGLMAPIMTVGTIFGPVYAGWIFDTTGSYGLALLSFAALMLVALLLLWKLPSASTTIR